MNRIPDGERDILRELNADARECERAWGREMTEEEIDAQSDYLIEEFRRCEAERVERQINRNYPQPDTDTEYPY